MEKPQSSGAASAQQTTETIVAAVEIQRIFRFKPCNDYPSLFMHQLPDANGTVTHVLRRPTIIFVMAVQPSDATWWRVRWFNKETWLQGIDPVTGDVLPCLHSVTSYRLYETWQGRNTFWCNGRCMLGPDASLLWLTNIMLLGPALTFIVLVAPYVDDNLVINVLLVLTAILLTLFCLNYLWRAALSDPGIIPPRPSWLPQETSPEEPDVADWKFCDTCNIYRPPRSSHESACNVCVERLDHHCPWTGNCIGIRNYRSFVLFLIHITLLTVLVFLASLSLIVRELMHSSFDRAGDVIAEYPVAAGLAIFTFMMLWSTPPLLCYHLRLICIGQTTKEAMRHLYRDRTNENDRGCIRNFRRFLCEPGPPPSRLPDFAETIQVVEAQAELSREEEGTRLLGALYTGTGQ